MLAIPTAIQNLVDTGRFAVRLMVRFDLDTGPTGLWNDTYDIIDNGVTYAGIAGNIEIDAFPEGVALNVDTLSINVGGLVSQVASLISTTAWHQRPVTVFVAFLDDAGNVQHLLVKFSGFLDAVSLSSAKDGLNVVAMSVESNNRELSRSRGRVRSDSDQRQVGGSGDGFFKHTAAANSNVDITWGRAGPQRPVR